MVFFSIANFIFSPTVLLAGFRPGHVTLLPATTVMELVGVIVLGVWWCSGSTWCCCPRLS